MVQVVIHVVVQMMIHVVGKVYNFVVDLKQTLCMTDPQPPTPSTFGLESLKMTRAPVRTSDKSPSVNAFHVFKAIKARANGTRTAVLNLSPRRNGTITFLTILDRPTTHFRALERGDLVVTGHS
jgi:hypothetical protein